MFITKLLSPLFGANAPKIVRTLGAALAVAALVVLIVSGAREAIGYGIGLAVALFAWMQPKAFNFLSNFADAQFWPAFVGFGVAMMFAAHLGHGQAVFALAGPLTFFDGMYFLENY